MRRAPAFPPLPHHFATPRPPPPHRFIGCGGAPCCKAQFAPSQGRAQAQERSLGSKAGGPAAAAGICNPVSAAYPPSGDHTAVSGTGSRRVQLFHADNGTLAPGFGWTRGGGRGQLDGPRAAACPPSGEYIAVADSGNDRVQMFRAGNGTIACTMGSRAGGLHGPHFVDFVRPP